MKDIRSLRKADGQKMERATAELIAFAEITVLAVIMVFTTDVK